MMNKANTKLNIANKTRTESYQYLAGKSYTVTGIKEKWAIGQIIDKETGAYVLRGGNGSYRIVVPPHIWLRTTDGQRYDIYDIVKQHHKKKHPFSSRLSDKFVRECCNKLLNKEINSNDVLGDITKLLDNI